MCLQGKFESPRRIPENKVTPSRYLDIEELDEVENWRDRTAVVTSDDHRANTSVARDIVEELVDNLPIRSTG